MRAHLFDTEISQRAFTGAPVLTNIREVLADIRARGERACLITMSPDYFAEQFLGFSLADAVAYGDSMSDVFLFGEVGVRIAVNADHHLSDLADVTIEGTDLMPAYLAARQLLDGLGRQL